MPTDENALTLALILTAAGATVAAGFVTGIVELFKQVLGNALDGKERLAAFFVSAVLVVVAEVAGVQDGTITLSIATVFAGVLAWYGIARLAIAHYADATKETGSLTGPAA